MFIPNSILKTSGTAFHDIVPVKAVYPLGKISLDVIFGNEGNFRKENLDFEVVDWKSRCQDQGESSPSAEVSSSQTDATENSTRSLRPSEHTKNSQLWT